MYMALLHCTIFFFFINQYTKIQYIAKNIFLQNFGSVKKNSSCNTSTILYLTLFNKIKQNNSQIKKILKAKHF